MKHTGKCYGLFRKMFCLILRRQKIYLFGKAANRANNTPPPKKKKKKKNFGPPIGWGQIRGVRALLIGPPTSHFIVGPESVINIGGSLFWPCITAWYKNKNNLKTEKVPDSHGRFYESGPWQKKDMYGIHARGITQNILKLTVIDRGCFMEKLQVYQLFLYFY